MGFCAGVIITVSIVLRLFLSLSRGPDLRRSHERQPVRFNRPQTLLIAVTLTIDLGRAFIMVKFQSSSDSSYRCHGIQAWLDKAHPDKSFNRPQTLLIAVTGELYSLPNLFERYSFNRPQTLLIAVTHRGITETTRNAILDVSIVLRLFLSLSPFLQPQVPCRRNKFQSSSDSSYRCHRNVKSAFPRAGFCGNESFNRPQTLLIAVTLPPGARTGRASQTPKTVTSSGIEPGCIITSPATPTFCQNH